MTLGLPSPSSLWGLVAPYHPSIPHTDLANVSSFWATLVKIYCHQKAETDPSYVLSNAVP